MNKLKKLGRWHFLAALAILVLGLELGGLVFEFKYKDRFYPGVMVGGESVGGQTYQAVFDRFKDRAEILATNGLEVSFSANQGEKKVIIPMSRTGLTPDTLVEYFSFGNLQAVIDQAYRFGRVGSVEQKFKERFFLLVTRRFDFPVRVYDEAIISLLEVDLAGWLTETIPARFSSTALGVEIIEEQVGEKVDLAAIVKTINNKLVTLNSARVNFEAEAKMPLVIADQLEPFLKLADELDKSTTLVFRYNGYKWKVSGATLATWLTIKSDGKIGIDQELAAFLNKVVVPAIDNPPTNSRFEMRGGELVEIVPGHAGKIVDVQKTISSIDVNQLSGVVEVPVVIIDAEPKVTKDTVEQYAIKDLVGTARTNFKGGSSDRRKNIAVGVSKLNGLLIAPGEEFSLVSGIGYVTKEDGYEEEYMIKDGKTIKALGGGLCQIATTLFRTVLSAGLPVTERMNHRYLIGYYGPGLDATIYGPHPDLRFINDTAGYILIQGNVNGDEVVFEFYGQKDGRTVAISEPEITNRIDPPLIKLIPTYDLPPNVTKCTEKARQGLTADAIYAVTYLNGKVKTQNFHSVYVPWQEVCLVGVAR